MAIIKANNQTISAITSLPAAITTGKILQFKTVQSTTSTSNTSSSTFVDGNPDPLGIFKDEDLIALGKMDLKDKLAEMTGRYEEIWDECEKEFSLTPIKFREKYLK